MFRSLGTGPKRSHAVQDLGISTLGAVFAVSVSQAHCSGLLTGPELDDVMHPRLHFKRPPSPELFCCGSCPALKPVYIYAGSTAAGRLSEASQAWVADRRKTFQGLMGSSAGIVRRQADMQRAIRAAADLSHEVQVQFPPAGWLVLWPRCHLQTPGAVCCICASRDQCQVGKQTLPWQHVRAELDVQMVVMPCQVLLCGSSAPMHGILCFSCVPALHAPLPFWPCMTLPA